MTADELFSYLTADAGLDEATAKVVMAAAKNEKVAARAAALRQSSEYDAILAKATKMEEEAKRAKNYQDWYEKNFPAIQKLQADAAVYTERYGPLDANTPPVKPDAKTFDADSVKKVVEEVLTSRVTSDLGPRFVGMTTGMMTVMERHMRNQRKSDIDWKKLDELAADPRIAGDVVKAYEEWDKPNMEAQQKAEREAEISRRVNEELAKRRTAEFFPAGADATPSSSPGLTRSLAKPSYDRAAVVRAAVTGDYDGGKVQ